jgi:hypothetical protein
VGSSPIISTTNTPSQRPPPARWPGRARPGRQRWPGRGRPLRAGSATPPPARCDPCATSTPACSPPPPAPPEVRPPQIATLGRRDHQPIRTRLGELGHVRSQRGLTLHPGGTKPGRRRKVFPVSDRHWTGRRLVALPPGSLADLLVAIPASLSLIVEPVLASPTTTRTPKPPKRGLDAVQHDVPPVCCDCRARRAACQSPI